MENKPNIDALIPHIHQIGEYLLMVHKNQPSGMVTIGSIHLKYFFNGEEIIQIYQTNKDGEVLKVLYNRKYE
ncbi:hypothetical protein [Sphingobacterium cellulitidis]|uniref:Uncharacterized protein n=1 Tax=Sphingobacterium cellulitidis TaxID=1768011 RepID=A0A8H9KYM2_9SPHI|nr:hypothetical protein [Sphingobacterium soli]MBA8985951.1 hypothetical protein [Sphingobacterium soli]GGE28328.1 hypothetical protein GCM10011516_27500 [Sphingobacterium soli]